MRKLILVVAMATSGCAATLTSGGEKIRIITADERASCSRLQLITATANLGPDKPGSALKKAMNQTAAAGGNSLYLLNQNNHWIDGASVAGEAYRCN